MTEAQHDEPDYAHLSPDTVLGAIDDLGYISSGQLLALNSYENRVYRVGLEEAKPLVAKFYRPARWSDEAILEEHRFCQALEAADIPVLAPIISSDRQSLHRYAGYRYAVYPMQPGRWPELEQDDDLLWMGRLIARIHNCGRSEKFRHRLTIDPETLGKTSIEYILGHGFIPKDIETAYSTLTRDLMIAVGAAFARAGSYQTVRLHGDCHRGNILWTEKGPHFVDLDDCCNGPAVQDLWMMLSGDRAEMSIQLSLIVEGYEQFADFDRRELHLIEALRALRMIHYAAWLAKRWEDPAFPLAFPWFNTQNYWESHILELREQLAQLGEPVLSI